MGKIRNIIFDLGNVLLTWNPADYLATLFDDGELVTKLHKAVFLSPEWFMLDRGVISQEKAVERLIQQHPELAREIKATFADWFSLLKPISSNVELLRSVKEQGYKVYALSNFHKDAFDYVAKKYEWFSLFDGMIISADHQVMKPEPGIYQLLLTTYELIPEECVFIDDSLANLAAASEFGIKGIHCESPDQLKLELNYLLNEGVEQS